MLIPKSSDPSTEACCTCATLLCDINNESTHEYDALAEKRMYESSEKGRRFDEENRRLECCGRVICGRCIKGNPRFAEYCPFCQIASPSSSKSVTPLPGSNKLSHQLSQSQASIASPPPYSATPNADEHGNPPAYTAEAASYAFLSPSQSNQTQMHPDVVHHVNHKTDTIPGLSLKYGVPLDVLRRTNGITSDHLLLARKTITIPGEYYKGGVSLSPFPVEGEEEDERKTKIVRFQRTCRVAEYDIALLYLQQASYDLDLAIERYNDDERWEKEHPLHTTKGKAKKVDNGRRRFF